MIKMLERTLFARVFLVFAFIAFVFVFSAGFVSGFAGNDKVVCGNKVCERTENYFNCPEDCPFEPINRENNYAVCGNKVCERAENHITCPLDCMSDFDLAAKKRRIYVVLALNFFAIAFVFFAVFLLVRHISRQKHKDLHQTILKEENKNKMKFSIKNKVETESELMSRIKSGKTFKSYFKK